MYSVNTGKTILFRVSARLELSPVDQYIFFFFSTTVLLADYWLTVLGLKKTLLLYKFFFLYKKKHFSSFFISGSPVPRQRSILIFVGGRFIKVRKSCNFNNCAILWKNSKLVRELIKYNAANIENFETMGIPNRLRSSENWIKCWSCFQLPKITKKKDFNGVNRTTNSATTNMYLALKLQESGLLCAK